MFHVCVSVFYYISLRDSAKHGLNSIPITYWPYCGCVNDNPTDWPTKISKEKYCSPPSTTTSFFANCMSKLIYFCAFWWRSGPSLQRRPCQCLSNRILCPLLGDSKFVELLKTVLS